MAKLISQFDPAAFDPSQSVGSLPIGKHPVVIESDEVKANKNNDGGYLQFNVRVIDGPNAGAIGAYRLNLYHTNAQTVEIANKQLSAVCHVVNVFRLGQNGDDTSVLHNIPFVVEVAAQKDNASYTEIKRVFDMNGNEPSRAGASAPANTQQQQSNQPQQQQPPVNQSGGGWGAGNSQQQQPANDQQQQQPQNNSGTGWGGGNQQQQNNQQQPQNNNSGGWNQNNNSNNGGGGGGAPWGARK